MTTATTAGADLSGKIALVTGATSAIGKAAALKLAEHGATVLVHGRDANRGIGVANAAGGSSLADRTWVLITECPRGRLGHQRTRQHRRRQLPLPHDGSSPVVKRHGASTDLFDGEYEPSPVPRIREQVALYEANDGTQGNTLEDRPVVILTTIGAKSGKVRKNPIMRIEDHGIYVAVASAAGAPNNPAWYGNLTAHPDGLVQDGAVVLQLRAREVSGNGKQHWWVVAERVWPHYPKYRERAAGREIPIVLLEPVTR